VYWTTAYASESLFFTVSSALAVAVGISHPSDWPYMFGRLGDLTGIRAFWGYVFVISFLGLLPLIDFSGEYGINCFDMYVLYAYPFIYHAYSKFLK
jgi:hypothetical protein